MPGLLNYTTSIPIQRTISEMQQMLVAAGALEISQRYVDGNAVGLTFTAPTQYGPQQFILPVDADAVRAVLLKNKPRAAKANSKPYSYEQAERVAWRVARSWLEAQLAMIQIGLAKIDQIMLPYMHVGDQQTVYDKYLESQQYLQIEAGE
jgi:hypothetical protein